MKIAIAGYGLEGKASLAYYAAQGEHELTILDERDVSDAPAGVRVVSGEKAFSRLGSYDLVVRTPSLHPDKLASAKKIWTATNEFFAQVKAPVIGVTGTKGKGTTATLIAEMLKAAGKTVWLVGNIGQPSLELLPHISPDDVVVYELSSFQLWDIEYSPHVAVVLMIEQDHQDVHGSMDEYVQAKAQIVRHQTVHDVCVYALDNRYATQIATRSQASTHPTPAEDGAHVRAGVFYYGKHKICDVGALRARGEHNQRNACAALEAARVFTDDYRAMADGIANFQPLPHRLAFVAEKSGISYYDDSISTTPSSTIAALASFDDKNTTLILGGSSKGADFSGLVSYIAEHHSRVRVITAGQEGARLQRLLEQAGVEPIAMAGSGLLEIVRQAKRMSSRGDIVLLSPACASFDQFASYADRGNQFIDAVERA